MVNQVAQAIFGPSWPQHIQYVIVPNADRIPRGRPRAGRHPGRDHDHHLRSSIPKPVPSLPHRVLCRFFDRVLRRRPAHPGTERVPDPTRSPDLAGKRVCAAKVPPPWLTSPTAPAGQAGSRGQPDRLPRHAPAGSGRCHQHRRHHPRRPDRPGPEPAACSASSLSNEPYGMAINKHYPDSPASSTRCWPRSRPTTSGPRSGPPSLARCFTRRPAAPHDGIPGLRRHRCPYRGRTWTPSSSEPRRSGRAGRPPLRTRRRAVSAGASRAECCKAPVPRRGRAPRTRSPFCGRGTRRSSQAFASIAARRRPRASTARSSTPSWSELTNPAVDLPAESLELARRCLPDEAAAALHLGDRTALRVHFQGRGIAATRPSPRWWPCVTWRAEAGRDRGVPGPLGGRRLGPPGAPAPTRRGSDQEQAGRSPSDSWPLTRSRYRSTRVAALADVCGPGCTVRSRTAIAELSGVDGALDSIDVDLHAGVENLNQARQDLARWTIKIARPRDPTHL